MKRFTKSSLVSIVTLAFVLGLAAPTAVFAVAIAPPLGTAASFSVLSGLSMSAAGAGTTVSADLGLSPGLAVSRTGPWTVGGQEYFGPSSLAFTAKADALIAYNNLITQGSSGTWSLNAAPVPGVWTAADSPVFPGPTLTLHGSAASVWVFQLSQDFTFTGNVVLDPGVNPCNVFWAVDRDATIAAGSHFVGTLFAGRTVTVASGAVVNGRVLSAILTSGSLTTDGNTISGCAVGSAAPSGGTRRDGTINVVKTVINDGGGTMTVAGFPLFVNGIPVISGTTNTYPGAAATVFTVSETSNSGYTRTFSGDCNAAGQVTLSPNQNLFCIITNNDIATPAVPLVPPIIDLVKVPSPLALPGGPGPVTYTYTLRNIGTVPVSNVTLVGDTCSPITLVSGDLNGDAKLDLTETWTYRCNTTLSATHTNTVVATGQANGFTATDIATATVVVGLPIVPPLIHVTKVPNPLALRAGGGMVTYTEKITNPGTVALSNVNLTDDKCAPLTYVSGDTNHDSMLQTTETWTYTCRRNLTQTTTNTAIATGDANGLTARDLAVVTVGVSLATLPSTGLPPEGARVPWNLAVMGLLIAASGSLVVALRKRMN